MFVIRTGVDHVKQFFSHLLFSLYSSSLHYISFLFTFILNFLFPPPHSSIDPPQTKSELVPRKNRSCINRFKHEREIWKGQKVRIYIFYDHHENQIFWPAVWKFVFNFKVGKFKKFKRLKQFLSYFKNLTPLRDRVKCHNFYFYVKLKYFWNF